jgi:hypothetical protein
MRGALQVTREIARGSPENRPNSAETLAYIGLWCSREPQEKEKSPISYFLFFMKTQGKISFLISLRQN